MNRSERILFGGSFDPPHHGHLEILNYIFTNNITKTIDIVPAAVSPFKMEKPPVSANARWDMLEIFCNRLRSNGWGPNCLQLHNIEIKRNPPSWTIETSRTLHKLYPKTSIGILLGADVVADLDKWESIEELWENHTFFIYPRPTVTIKKLRTQIRRLVKLSMHKARMEVLWDAPCSSCSSSVIRKLLQQKDGKIRLKKYLLPGVLDYIYKNDLYATD